MNLLDKKRFKNKLIYGLLFFLLLAFCVKNKESSLFLSPKLAHQIGLQIWKNECGQTIEGLVQWNKGEDFASLGIGHFIWFSESNPNLPIKESFPALLRFFKSKEIVLPVFLKEPFHCPWTSRENFQKMQRDPVVNELRDFLSRTIDLQILFMVERLNHALRLMTKDVSIAEKRKIHLQFNRLIADPAGLYTLVDYLNFKGEGLVPKSSYSNYRWGLLQVLEKMEGEEKGLIAVEEFVKQAKDVLKQRVLNSPQIEIEKEWLPGWYNRLDTYPKFIVHEMP